MRRGALAALLVSLSLAGLALMLRHDLALLAWREGREALSAGDHPGALRSLQRAEALGRGSADIAFDTGIALYRLGDFPRAAARFASAGAAKDPVLRAAALYNLGNCAFREAQQKEASDRAAASRLLQQAAGEYGRALAVDPGAADARHNLELARTRLAAVSGAADAGSRAKTDGDKRAPDGTGKDGRSQTAKREGEKGGASRSERGEQAPGRTPGESAPDAARPGKPRAQLTLDQAERLLGEARGREAFAARLPGSGGRGRLAPPDKDW